MLLHGLRSLLGPDVVDIQRISAMYRTSGPGSYTVWGLLPHDSFVDRTDIPKKISTRYFDIVVYGDIFHDLSFFDQVVSAYPPSRVIFVDGLDDSRVMQEVDSKGIYLKREFSDSNQPRESIQFAIPREKIIHDNNIRIVDKIRLMSQLDPRDRSTYIYTDEPWYYRQYTESYFGYTMKKGGWDCMRHYEILAAGAIPYFAGLENCPPTTMEHMPKELLIEARKIYDVWSKFPEAQWDLGIWQDMYNRLRKVLYEKLTTEALAKRIIERGMR
jgi:hypothetical protein